MSVKPLTPAQLGRRIRTARLKLGLSQEQVAEPVYSAAYISHVEKGKRHPSQEALAHISSRLGMTLEQLTSGRDPDEDLRLEVASQRAVGEIHSGRAKQALEVLQGVRARAKKVDNVRVLELVESATGLALYHLGRVDEARAAYERAIELAADGPAERRTTALVGKARCLFQSDEPREAVHLLEAHLIELQRSDPPDPSCLVETYAALIPGYFETGMIELAKDVAAKGWKLAPDVPDMERRACLCVNRAQLMLTQGEPRAALASLALAEDLYRNLGWYRDSVKVALAKSFVLTDQGELEEAEHLLRDALAGSGSTVSKDDRIRALTRLSLIRRRRGEPEEGLELAKEALKLAGSRFKDSAAEAERELGLCEVALGYPESALDHWRRALEMFVKVRDHEEVAKTARLIGDHLADLGDPDGAAEAYRRGLASVEELR